MSSKTIVYLSSYFPAKKADVYVKQTRVPILGTPITTKPQERAPDDYSFMFQGF